MYTSLKKAILGLAVVPALIGGLTACGQGSSSPVSFSHRPVERATQATQAQPSAVEAAPAPQTSFSSTGEAPKTLTPADWKQDCQYGGMPAKECREHGYGQSATPTHPAQPKPVHHKIIALGSFADYRSETFSPNQVFYNNITGGPQNVGRVTKMCWDFYAYGNHVLEDDTGFVLTNTLGSSDHGCFSGFVWDTNVADSLPSQYQVLAEGRYLITFYGWMKHQ